jgi:tricorn protease
MTNRIRSILPSAQRLFSSVLALMCGLACSIVSAESPKPLLLRDPAVSQTQIAFSYASNIWIASRDGRNPHQLTIGGHDRKPRFSPDGTWIAYTGEYGNVGYGGRNTGAVYVVPAAGGEPRRLTYHPTDIGAVG